MEIVLIAKLQSEMRSEMIYVSRTNVFVSWGLVSGI